MKKTISGIRGIFGDDFDLIDVMRYCENFSSLVKSGKCVVGRDTRQSGNMVLESAKAALMKSGIDVYDLGMVPTPVIFREARKYGAGVIATSSHNPADWNGLKFIINGRGINKDELKVILENQDTHKQNIGAEYIAETTYLEEVARTIGNIGKNPDIIVDAGGGAARDFAPNLLQDLGCSVRIINHSLEECNRSPDPTSDNLEELCSLSLKADIGFAFDLDGDRLVVVKDGKKQSPDMTLALGIAKSIKLGCRKFVLSADSSVGIEIFAKEHGCSVQRSSVGEANVIDMMLKTKAHAGGEGSSGGFILADFNHCRDGILTGGLVASMLGEEFDEILKYMKSYQQARIKVDVNSTYHDDIIEKVSKDMSDEFSDVNDMDGIKGIIDEKSWVLIRKSNTEDVIRISVESDGVDRCRDLLEKYSGLVNMYHEEIR
ncbi:MAG: phosphomannomutase [Thaumarchaeota archaeon]|nr:phosphomannomutase [Nitrososphaerota archaeon]